MLKKNIIGIDVSDQKIRILQLTEEKEVVTSGTLDLPEGVVVDGYIKDKAAFVAIAQKALKETKPVPIEDGLLDPVAIVSLPEGAAWSHTAALPKTLVQKEYEHYVNDAASKIIPLDLSQLYTAMCTSTVRGVTYATFVGAPKSVIDTYSEYLGEAGIDVDFIGSHLFSVARAALPAAFQDSHYVLVDIGERCTMVGAFDQNAIAMITVESTVLTDDLDKDSVAEIGEDVKKVLAYFAEATGETVNEVRVTGQLSQKAMDSVVRRLARALEPKVVLADVYQHIQQTQSLAAVNLTSLADVIGLALYGVDRTLPHVNLLHHRKRTVSYLMPARMRRIVFSLWQRCKPPFARLRSVGSDASTERKISLALILTAIFLLLCVGALAFVVFKYML